MSYFHPLNSAAISKESLPKVFPYPFYYKPDDWAKQAVTDLQNYLENTTDLAHNFGINSNKNGIVSGKMFGVLIVKNQQGELGYLAAFSGNLLHENKTHFFVPPVVDLFDPNGFYLKEKENLLALAKEIEAIKNNDKFQALQNEVTAHYKRTDALLGIEKEKLDKRKKARKTLKKKAHLLDVEALKKLQEALARENQNDTFYYRELSAYYTMQIASKEQAMNVFKEQLKALKKQLKAQSNVLGKRIEAQFQFLDAKQEKKSLEQIFTAWERAIPAGAGECAAPKLLQYAFLNKLEPLTMAEFWWGEPTHTTIRKHKHYYPACRGKCEPILTYMLQNTNVAENPLLQDPKPERAIEIIYEDDAIAVLNKPAELLSVPGKTITDSVLTRMKKRYPDATGPLLVHRLDMATSGILLLAKNEAAHKELQAQFIRRTIKKRYVALLDGEVRKDKGTIDLPLRVDLDNRPKQMVCYEYGKNALTQWKLIERKNGKSKVFFYPITGRTHQLRVHAAHDLGLNIPIVGDDLYGKASNRLYLQAQYIIFKHPVTNKKMHFKLKPDF